MDDDEGWGDSFEPPTRKKMTKQKAMLGDWAEDEDDDEFSHFSGSKSSGRKQSSGKAASSSPFMFVSSGVFDLASGKKEEEEEAKPAAPSPAPEPSKKKSKAAPPPPPTLGQWERHTKGVGSKMMKKMGWTGKGLGNEEAGIVQPIQAVTRMAGMGLAEDDYMGVQKSAYRRDEEEEEVIVIDDKADEERKGQWRKTTAKAEPSAPRAPKVVYKTKEEYERDLGLDSQKQVILDMRGPQSSSNQMDVSMPEIPTFLPQLRHNLTHLVELRVNAIHSIVKKRHYDEQMLASLKEEEVTLQRTVEAQKADISVLTALKERLEMLKQRGKDDETFDLFAFFEELKDTFSDEYKRYKLESLVFHYVFPRIVRELEPWRPLEQPDFSVETALKWRKLLQTEKSSIEDEDWGVYDDGYGISSRLHQEKGKSDKKKTLDTYNRLMYEVYLPRLRQALSEWDVYNPDPALDLLYVWKPILPSTGYNFLLFHLVLEKLKYSLDQFQPGQLPLDAWIPPWIPIMGAHNVPDLLETIRRKLQQAISTVSSASQGIELCSPWKTVLDSQNWAQLMARSVISKIEALFRSVEIDPSAQVLDSWNEALVWSKLISVEALSMALNESGFWKRWFIILGQWLTQDNVDLDQVQQWYSSWKSVFPLELASSAFVQPQFRRALQLMLATSSGEVPPMSEFIPVKVDYSNQQKERENEEKAAKERNAQQALMMAQNMSLRQVIEDYAASNGILFMNTGRKLDGNPIYQLGKLQLYFERDLVYCVIEGVWQSTSISYVLGHV